MEQKHTPEPWRVSGNGTMRFIDASVGNGMAQEVATCMRVEHGDMEANARRIVACVNACRGLSTDELERFGLASAFGTELIELEKQRDQLLAAIEALTYEQDGRYFTGIHGDTDVTELVAAAVASAKGGAV